MSGVDTLADLLRQAREDGQVQASIEKSSYGKGELVDRLHHLGDPLGKIISRAFEQYGVDAATAVITTYLVQVNAARQSAGESKLTLENSVAILEQAINPYTSRMTREDQHEVRNAIYLLSDAPGPPEYRADPSSVSPRRPPQLSLPLAVVAAQRGLTM